MVLRLACARMDLILYLAAVALELALDLVSGLAGLLQTVPAEDPQLRRQLKQSCCSKHPHRPFLHRLPVERSNEKMVTRM